MKPRRELLLAILICFSASLAFAGPGKSAQLEVTYYYLPG
jgi:hypothetical protein